MNLSGRLERAEEQAMTQEARAYLAWIDRAEEEEFNEFVDAVLGQMGREGLIPAFDVPYSRLPSEQKQVIRAAIEATDRIDGRLNRLCWEFWVNNVRPRLQGKRGN